MPKSRGRRPRKAGHTSGIQGLQQLPLKRANQKASKLSVAKRISENPVFIWIVIIGAFFGLRPVLDAFEEPSISFEGQADLSSPLASPFTITNKSNLFSIRYTQVICRIDHLKTRYGLSIDNVYLVGEIATSIDSNNTLSLRCKVRKGARGAKEIIQIPDDIVSAHIFLSVEYRTILFDRTSSETEFTWFTNADPPRWVKGKLIE